MNAIVTTMEQSTDAAEKATNRLLSILGEKSQNAKSGLERLIGELQPVAAKHG